ncbi:MlaD family protein [Methylibium sp.]|uniref:MlaD family protein n=1 Tax=Methylibium sp. TaxID=2067992 RepID=UPI003D0BF9F9
MENRAHALVAGLFIVLMGAALLGAVAWFQGSHTSTVTYTVVTRLPVLGLNVKAPVKLRGVEIGKVQAIRFDPEDGRQILIDIAVDPAAPLTRATYAQLGFQGVTGLSFVALDDAVEGTAAPAPLAAADATRRIELRPSLLDQLAVAGPALLAGVGESTKRINAVLSDGNQQQLGRSLSNLESASAQMSQLLTDLSPAAKALPALVAHADRTVVEAGSLAQRIDSVAVETLGLAQDVRTRSVALDRLADAASQLESTARSIELSLVGENRPHRVALTDDIARSSRAVERAADQLTARPQSLLFGAPALPPGPGEAGFEPLARERK